MMELTYKIIMENDLQNLNAWKFAITQIQAELETLDAEYASIKATNFDKMPAGSGENVQEEKLVSVIARKDQKESELKFNRMRVADLERLLDQLDDDERRIIERMVVSKEKNATADLSEETGYEIAQLYRIKNRVLMKMARLRHGASFHP